MIEMSLAVLVLLMVVGFLGGMATIMVFAGAVVGH
jgi:hypothetical protein